MLGDLFSIDFQFQIEIIQSPRPLWAQKPTSWEMSACRCALRKLSTLLFFFYEPRLESCIYKNWSASEIYLENVWRSSEIYLENLWRFLPRSQFLVVVSNVTFSGLCHCRMRCEIIVNETKRDSPNSRTIPENMMQFMATFMLAWCGFVVIF